MLTGKCKEDFEKWFSDNVFEVGICGYDVWADELFDTAPFPMRYGTYIDFFDSIGFRLGSVPKITGYKYTIKIEAGLTYSDNKEYDTRNEARQKAILKANEIYNEATR